MGSRGPVPKRMAERLGHVTKAQKAGVVSVRMEGVVKPAPLPRGAHPIARRWYEALKASGQSMFFEPSDWAAAVLVAEMMTRLLNSRRVNGQLFTGVWAAMDDLLTTEQARRRARLEVQRGMAEADEDAPTAIDDYKKAMGLA